MTTIDIRPALSWDDCLQCEALQKIIWRTPDNSEAVPASLLVTVQNNGGLLLGAYEGSKMVGFVFGFLGVEGEGEVRHVKHCSHMLGVLPDYRGLGLGLQLKEKQREYLIAQGLDLATWTYDPLQSINASLNIRRLGGIVRRYLRDAYGEMHDALNVGVASDRFEVQWWLNSRRVRDNFQRTEDHLPKTYTNIQPLYQVEFEDKDLPRVISESSLESGICSVEIPADFNAMKERNLTLAQAWRGLTRVTFEAAFAKGYLICDVIKWRDDRLREHVAYILGDQSQVV